MTQFSLLAIKVLAGFRHQKLQQLALCKCLCVHVQVRSIYSQKWNCWIRCHVYFELCSAIISHGYMDRRVCHCPLLVDIQVVPICLSQFDSSWDHHLHPVIDRFQHWVLLFLNFRYVESSICPVRYLALSLNIVPMRGLRVLRQGFVSFPRLCRSPLFTQTTVRLVTLLSMERDMPSSYQHFEQCCCEPSRARLSWA